MKRTLKTFLFLCLLTGCQEQADTFAPTPLAAPPANAGAPQGPVDYGTDVGNGGDHVRSTFFRLGEAVVKFLEEEEAGKNITQNARLDLKALRESLTIQKVATLDGELKDNGGSDVDAVGVPGKITLKRSSWMEHFEKERDVYYLVFHEMLRSIAVGDDNYVISKALFPFSGTKVPTRVSALLPLIPEENLSTLITKNAIQFAGPGCPTNASKTYADFDAEKNTLELTFKGYSVEVLPEATGTLARSNCGLALPFRAPEGKRLTISQIDLSGTLHLPVGTKAVTNIEAFTPTTAGQKYTRTIESRDEDLHGRFQIRSNDTFSTPCGTAENLRVATSLRIDGKAGSKTSAKVERLTVYLKLENCE